MHFSDYFSQDHGNPRGGGGDGFRAAVLKQWVVTPLANLYIQK